MNDDTTQKNKVISSPLLVMAPTLYLDFICPYCGALLARWGVAAKVRTPFLSDGDSICRWKKEPWEWMLYVTEVCPNCTNQAVMATAQTMSAKYILETWEPRLDFNVERGAESFFTCAIESSENIDNWNMVECRSQSLPPLQWHLIGPFKILDKDLLLSPYGAIACSQAPDFQNAAEELKKRWSFITELTEERQRLWETGKQDASIAFENRATLRPEGHKEVLCPHCDEPLVFGMKDKFHEFSIGLTAILECIVMAEKEGFIPAFSDDWWVLLIQRYPYLAGIRDHIFNLCPVGDNPRSNSKTVPAEWLGTEVSQEVPK